MRLAFLLIVCWPAFLIAGTDFEYDFHDRTMRIDLNHSGIKGEEEFSLDGVRSEGPWAGSRVNLIDTLNLGEYYFRVFDQTTGRLIYSRGYSTIFNEWQTTDEASKGIRRTFSETIRFPYPRKPVQISILRREDGKYFHEQFSFAVDPNNPVEVRKEERPRVGSYALIESGPPHEKVDIVIIGDGYARGDMEKYRADAKRFNDALFATEPFKSRKSDFNVWVVELESIDSGIDVPDRDIWKNNALGTSYNTFGSARYVLTEENETLRDVAASVPYDFISLLINDTRYGGGGIYNLFATTYTREQTSWQEWQMDYVYVHELGHSFAGLGDEYYSSSTAYNDFYPPGVEPWEPNITAHATPSALKWKALASDGLAIPTPWKKAEYDSLERERGKLDRLADDYYEKREPLYQAAMTILRTSPDSGKVGAFKGAGYASEGLFRPSVDCRMFSLSLVDFDPVCTAAINRMIDFYSR